MTIPPSNPTDAKLDVAMEAILFLVRHGAMPNLADAFIADLHRTFAGDAARRTVIDGLAFRLREHNEFVDENDA